MRTTGIIRRIDELGRVVIPREIRKTCGIHEGDPLEIFMDRNNGQPVVCFCKYETSFLSSLNALADAIDDEMINNELYGQQNEIRNHFNEIIKILKECENRG